MTIQKIKIGAEDYVPKLSSNKSLFQEVGPNHRVINFSDYVVMPYSEVPEPSKACVSVEAENKNGKYTYVVDAAKLAQALRLQSAQKVIELAEKSKLVQKIQEVSDEGEKEKRELLKQVSERFDTLYAASDEIRKIFGDDIIDDFSTMIRAALGKLYRSSLPEYNGQAHYHETQNKKIFVIVLKEQNGLRIVYIEKYIASGGFATVFKVKSVLDRMDLALKVANSNEKAHQKLDKEFENYAQLYGNLPAGSHITGLQMNCYRKLSDLPLKVDKTGAIRIIHPPDLTCGLLMPFYCFGSLYSFIKRQSALNLTQLNKGWKEDGCYQLILGACHLETEGKVNVDTCLVNTFVTERNEQGFLQFDLGDLEGIISFKTYKKNKLTYHSKFIRFSELILMQECLDDCALFEKKMENVAPKAAAFSLTVVLFALLTQQLTIPFQVKEVMGSSYPDCAKRKPMELWDGLEKENKKLASLFESILFSESAHRRTPKRLLKRFHAVMEVQNPELHKKYDQQVKDQLQSKPKEKTEEKED
ncbi:MAG TPA: hypothetical protein VLG76_02490 [Rhabdochlamydiaceae bacterium]|nr:hypothetical protein [Rhabdochlamydiaceae bacterium]